MPSASSLMLSCFCCRMLLLEIFLELDENLRRFFNGQIRTGARRASPAEVHKGPRGSHPRVTGGLRPGVASAPRAPPRDALWPINHTHRENPNPRRIFPNTIRSSATIADKFQGSDCLFRHPAVTGIGPRSHLRRHRCLRDEL